MGQALSESSNERKQTWIIDKKRNALHPANRTQRNPFVLQIAEALCRLATRACTRSSCRFVSRELTGGQLIPGQHANCFHNSRILSNAVPLGFWFGGFSSTAGYAPATKLNLR
jgi:hypothetical protein